MGFEAGECGKWKRLTLDFGELRTPGSTSPTPRPTSPADQSVEIRYLGDWGKCNPGESCEVHLVNFRMIKLF